MRTSICLKWLAVAVFLLAGCGSPNAAASVTLTAGPVESTRALTLPPLSTPTPEPTRPTVTPEATTTDLITSTQILTGTEPIQTPAIPEATQNQEQLWIANEIISVDENGIKASFGFSLGYDETTFTKSTIKQLKAKLAEYAKANNIANPLTLSGFEFNSNNPDARRNQVMEIISALLWTYNIQNGTNISLQKFTSNPEKYPFKIWGVGNKVITLTLNRIENVKIVLTSESVDEKVKTLYFLIPGYMYRLGYDFTIAYQETGNGTLTMYAPMQSINEITHYLFNKDYPLQHPEKMNYALPVKFFEPAEAAIYQMPFSMAEKKLKDTKGNANDLGPLKNKLKIAIRDILGNARSIGTSNDFGDPLWDAFLASNDAQGIKRSAPNGFAEMGEQYGNYVLK